MKNVWEYFAQSIKKFNFAPAKANKWPRGSTV